jgi:hypothetical protein
MGPAHAALGHRPRAWAIPAHPHPPHPTPPIGAQDDVLYETLTVRETLTYAGLLRLPRSMPKVPPMSREWGGGCCAAAALLKLPCTSRRKAHYFVP